MYPTSPVTSNDNPSASVTQMVRLYYVVPTVFISEEEGLYVGRTVDSTAVIYFRRATNVTSINTIKEKYTSPLLDMFFLCNWPWTHCAVENIWKSSCFNMPRDRITHNTTIPGCNENISKPPRYKHVLLWTPAGAHICMPSQLGPR